MAIPEEEVTKVVNDISSRMTDPSYGQLAIGAFIEVHPDVSRFLAAKLKPKGGGEAVMHALFHAHVLAECVARHRGEELPAVRFRELDAAATHTPEEALADKEPALLAYLTANVESAPVRAVLAHVALSFRR